MACAFSISGVGAAYTPFMRLRQARMTSFHRDDENEMRVVKQEHLLWRE